MLLDKYVLTKGFERLMPGTGSGPPAGFLKRVNQSMARIDPLLKTLQVRPAPAEGLVQAYLIHIGDKSDSNFKKILELKGVRKAEQPHLMELFQAHRSSPAHESLPQNSPLLTSINLQEGKAGGVAISMGGALTSAAPTIQNRFDTGLFGSAIMNAANAARDGVERMGTPGATANPQSAEGKGAINENLRNIGKFFRRESGFPARFGGGRGIVDEGPR